MSAARFAGAAVIFAGAVALILHGIGHHKEPTAVAKAAPIPFTCAVVGVLTVAIPGRPVVQVTTPAKVRDRQHPAMSASGDFPEREHSTPEGALFAQMFPNGNVPKLGLESPKLGMPRKARRKAAGEPPCAGASDTGPGQPADG